MQSHVLEFHYTHMLLYTQRLPTRLNDLCYINKQAVHEYVHFNYSSTIASALNNIDLSSGRTSSTSTSSCTVTTHHPTALVLPQPCCAPRVPVSRSQRFYIDYAVRREYSSLGRTGSTSATPCAASTRLSVASTLHQQHRTSGCLGTSHGSSHGSFRRSSSTTSPTPRVRVPRHVARVVTRLIVDYSVRCDFVLRPHWLYFNDVVRRDYLSRGNTSSPSSTPCAAATSPSSRITSTIHLD
jgi:hypothetical protein